MEKVKFKVWDRTKKKMYLVSKIGYAADGFAETVSIYPVLQASHEEYAVPLIHGENGELLQYTGKLDKNKTEIYNGDILGGEEGDLLAIRWDEEDASFIVDVYNYNIYTGEGGQEVEENELSVCDSQTMCGIENYEIIGNCWENPELLNR